MDQSFYLKFPNVLKTALQHQLVQFPNDIQYTFKEFIAYRVIVRPDMSDWNIRKEDFESHIEQLKRGKRIRPVIDENDINYYSCSLFTDKEHLKTVMNLPRSTKKIIKGPVNSNDGVINIKGTHINWWLYHNSDPVNKFEVIDNE